MPVPGFQDSLLPTLEELASDHNEHSLADARKHLATQFRITEDSRASRRGCFFVGE